MCYAVMLYATLFTEVTYHAYSPLDSLLSALTMSNASSSPTWIVK